MKNKSFVWCLLAVVLPMISQPVLAGPAGMTVHEWGTFTSFQGGDGKLLPWQPLVTSHLPDFVHSVGKPGPGAKIENISIAGKFSLMALQRLETPVLYFYSDAAQSADVTVRFPDGWLTEWYPQADLVSRSDSTGVIQWSGLQVFPSSHGSDLASHPATPGEHYFAARATDSDYVKTKDETDKFLFYRGAGNFATPLRVTMTNDSFVTLANTGQETIPQLFVFQLETAGGFVSVSNLKPGEERSILAPLARKAIFDADDPDLARAVGHGMTKALGKAGLYPREAQAMVHTWNDSWFREEGLRVMYILPRPWTDRALPMTLHPTPKELVRVMVGRAEVLRPGLEKTLVSELYDAREGDKSATARARQTLKSLGRFAAPALYRAIAANKQLQPEECGRLYSLLNGPAAFE